LKEEKKKQTNKICWMKCRKRKRRERLDSRKRQKIDKKGEKREPLWTKFRDENEFDDIHHYVPLLQNTVSMISTTTLYEHRRIAHSIPSYEFSTYKFAVAANRIQIDMDNTEIPKKETVLTYTTGKFIAVGPISIKGARIMSNIHLHDIGKIEIVNFVKSKKGKFYINDIKFYPKSRTMRYGNMQTSNTVYKCVFESDEIFLNELRINNQEYGKYSPNAFPGVRYHGKYATYLIFQTGYVLILGLSKQEDLMKAYYELENVIYDSVEKAKSRKMISKYIWKLDADEELLQVSEEKKEHTKWIEIKKRQIKIVNKQKRSGVDNFEDRLVKYHSDGKYYDVDISNMKKDMNTEVRDSVSTTDFIPRITNLVQSYLYS